MYAILLFIAVALVVAIVTIAAGLAVMYGLFFLYLKTRPCPRCQKRGLKMAGALKFDGLDESGRPFGGSMTYHLCPSCNARLICKNKEWQDASDEEWHNGVSKNESSSTDHS